MVSFGKYWRPWAGREETGVGKPIDVTDSTFDQEVLKSDKPVLVDFWAPWCGPCRAIAPVLSELAEQRQDQIKVAKVNIDEHQQYAARLRVMTVPTLVLFKDGQPVGHVTGGVPRNMIVGLLDRHLNAPVAQG